MKKLLSLFLVISAVFLVSCSIINGNAMNQNREFQQNDSEKNVNLSVGDSFTVTLDANATTGYQWKIIKCDNSIIKLVNSKYDIDSKLIGAGGKQIYNFEVTGKGDTELEIIYHRPWEKDVKPVLTFELNIFCN